MSLDTPFSTSNETSLSLDSLVKQATEAKEAFAEEKRIISQDPPDYPILDENELSIAIKKFKETFQKGGKKAALAYFATLGQFCQDYIAKNKPYNDLLRAAKFQF